MAGSLGPNSAQVKEFLRRLERLSPQQWSQVQEDSARAKAAFIRHAAPEPEGVLKHAGAGEDWINAALRDLFKQRESLKLGDVLTEHAAIGLGAEATMALTVCAEIEPSEFAARYGAFSKVIPLPTLGRGLAPAMPAIPETVPERFFTWVQALDGPDWNSVLQIDRAMEVAFGIQQSSAALDAAVAAIERLGDASLATRVLDQLDQELTAFRMQKSAVRSVAGFLERETSKHSDWGEQAQDRIDKQEQAAKEIAIRAAAALLAGDGISDSEFWTLYLPFAALIPPNTLI